MAFFSDIIKDSYGPPMRTLQKVWHGVLAQFTGLNYKPLGWPILGEKASHLA